MLCPTFEASRNFFFEFSFSPCTWPPRYTGPFLRIKEQQAGHIGGQLMAVRCRQRHTAPHFSKGADLSTLHNRHKRRNEGVEIAFHLGCFFQTSPAISSSIVRDIFRARCTDSNPVRRVLRMSRLIEDENSSPEPLRTDSIEDKIAFIDIETSRENRKLCVHIHRIPLKVQQL